MSKSSEHSPHDSVIPEQTQQTNSEFVQAAPHIPVNPQNSQQWDNGGALQQIHPQRPQHYGMRGVEEIRAKWKQQIADAKSAWGKLTEYELLKSEGHKQKLADLVRGRYVVSRHEAERQVKRFFNEHES